jgi:hypothetical protein
MSSSDCSLDLRVEGVIEFNGDFTDVIKVSSGGFFRLDSTEAGVRRQLDIEPRGSALTRTYRVNGQERPYDSEAQTWFSRFLINLDRRTAIGVDVRLPKLLELGGVAAVLAETAQMSGDYARDRYFQKLMDARTLNAGEMTRMLDQAASLTRSDHYAAELLKRASRARLTEPAALDAALRMIEGMKSDHYKAEGLQDILRADIARRHHAAIAAAVRGIKSDHYALEVIRAAARHSGAARADAAALIAALDGLSSDHYEAEAIRAILTLPDLTAPDLLTMVRNRKRPTAIAELRFCTSQ